MLEFQEMSEDDAVRVFLDDGYYEYKKRRERYGDFLPNSSIWANAPARMFVGFIEETPVGVIGFIPYKGVLLSAGAHIRRQYRRRGLLERFVQKILQEKGSKTLFINLANPSISAKYRSMGFKDMNKDELPDEIREELEGIQYPDQVQKWIWGVYRDAWFDVVKNGIR